MIKGLQNHNAALVTAAAEGFHANAMDVSGNNVPLSGGTFNPDGLTVADALSTATAPLPPAPVTPLTPADTAVAVAAAAPPAATAANPPAAAADAGSHDVADAGPHGACNGGNDMHQSAQIAELLHFHHWG
jgi:hypothetical protein